MRWILLSCLFFSGLAANAQEYGGSFFGFKGGLSIVDQQWTSFNRSPLLAYHGDVFVETLPEEGRFSLYLGLGYHVKGSALRNLLFVNPFNGNTSRAPTQNFKFNNIALSTGAKQRFLDNANTRLYYALGIRLEYTISTNLDQFSSQNQSFPSSTIYPFEESVRKITYGISVGGGIEMPLSEFVELFAELSVQPDFALQYQQGAIENVIDPWSSMLRTIPERRIRNLAIELSVGMRFLRRVEYID